MSKEEAKILGKMMELFNRFTVTTLVNYPGGQTGSVTYWTSIRAEQEYNRLKKWYDDLQKKEG